MNRPSASAAADLAEVPFARVMKTIGFHYHIPVLQKPDGLFMPGYLGRFVDALAARCERVICFQHRPNADEESLLDYRIVGSNVEYVDIGPHASVPVRTIRSGRFVRPILEKSSQLDAMILRGPSPLLPSIAARLTETPVALYLVGDYAPRVDHLPQPRWRKELIRVWVRWYEYRQRQIASQCLPLVISRSLYDEFSAIAPQTRLVTAASIDDDDFYVRDDTCTGGPPYRLLYTGRIAPFKGIFELVDAVRHLADRGIDVTLDLVGWAGPKDRTISAVRDKARDFGMGERVRYRGAVPFGPELFRVYREADIYVLAPRDSEGGPRAIWEAMASSLPVVCTRVGGIPDLLEDRHSARLVTPRRADEFADAVQDVIEDGDLRRRLIRHGRELAREHTLSSLVEEMLGAMEERFHERIVGAR